MRHGNYKSPTTLNTVKKSRRHDRNEVIAATPKLAQSMDVEHIKISMVNDKKP
jgi:hypothetical protein